MTIIGLKAKLSEMGALFTPPATLSLADLEENIGFSFPEDYKVYLQNMGTIFLNGKETYGIVDSRNYYLNVDKAVHTLRRLPAYPMRMLPLASSGDGAWFLYDSDSGRVFSWQVAGEIQDQQETLFDFLKSFFNITM